MNFKGYTYFSLLGQNFPHFLVEKKSETKKTQKNKFLNFFFNSYFFMENRQIGSKTGQKYHRHVFTPYKLFWKKNNLI